MEKVSQILHHKYLKRSSGKNGRQNLLNRLIEITAGSPFVLAVLGFLVGRVSILNDLTPFGVAYLVSSSLIADGKSVIIAGISIVAGVMTRGNGGQALQAVLVVMILYAGIRTLKIDNETTILKAAGAAFIMNFLASLLFNLVTSGQFILYDILLGLFNSTIIMALIYIFTYSMPLIVERKRRRVLSNEEMICISIACAVILSGLDDILIYGISIKVVLSIFIITAVAFNQGAGIGTAIGTTIGLITCISSNQVPLIIGTYAFCGLLSGIFKDMGKLAAGLGFAIGNAIILFYLGGESNIIGFEELIIGLVLFLLTPVYILEKIIPLMDSSSRALAEQQVYAERVKDMIRAKISHMTDVFRQLSKSLQDNEISDELRQNSDINSIINSIADKVCADCDASNICWKRDFYSTFQNMFDIIDVVQSDGGVDQDTIPADLRRKCLKVNQLIKTSNYMYDLYRANYKWRRKAQESKRVVCEQLDGISCILMGLNEDIRKEAIFCRDIEEELAVALDKEGIDFNDIAVLKDESGKIEVSIYKRACLGKRRCIKEVMPVISRVLKKKMSRDKASCMIKEGTNLCYFRLGEAVKYQITTGVSRAVKDGVSGDNYSFSELDEGKYMMALSDGMGTGPTAALESSSAISLLEKYLEAGFDRATTLKAINSAMTLRSPDDNFATIDLAIIDMYSGSVELVKIGAASTYVKKADGNVEIINSTTLPIGILNNVDTEVRITKISHGDMIIMVTDGVQEAGERNKDDWVMRTLENVESKNPQQVAEEIILRARERSCGSVNDDMTVLVSKIWEII